MARRVTTADIDRARRAIGNRTVVLVGLMGAGKTSVGRRLAGKLDIPFVDADHEIEAAAGKTIPEIFADHGEQYFRDGEKRVIARLLENGPKVLATGGGAFMNAETRAVIGRQGISVWLKAELALLMKRVAKRSNRPLLNTENPAAVMQNLIDQRYPVYAHADCTVESRDAQHAHTVNEVIRTLSNWQDAASGASDHQDQDPK